MPAPKRRRAPEVGRAGGRWLGRVRMDTDGADRARDGVRPDAFAVRGTVRPGRQWRSGAASDTENPGIRRVCPVGPGARRGRPRRFYLT
ncbi:hypothetical protein GCM10022630_31020 [Thermobifida alba]